MSVISILSPDEAKVIDELLSLQTSARGLLPGARSSSTHLLDQLASCRELGLVPGLAAFAVAATTEERQKANQILSTILGALDAKQFLELDQNIRGWPWMPELVSRRWSKIARSHVEALSAAEPGADALLGALSLHPSGHVREAAVRKLGDVHGGLELRYLLVRLNDWVPVVRSASQKVVHARLTPDHAAEFAANLDMTARMLVWERADHSALLHWIVGLLRDVGSLTAVETALMRAAAPLRRVIYLLLMESETGLSRSLLDRALLDEDAIVRLRGIRAARSHLPEYELAPILSTAVRDPFAAIRVEAVRGLSTASASELRPTFWMLLLDSASSVRAAARYALAQAGESGFSEFYNAKLAQGSVREVRSALLGIAEVGDSKSVMAVLPYFKHRNAGIAATALRAVALLDGDNHLPLFMGALGSSSVGVVREAVRALVPRVRAIDLDAVSRAAANRPWDASRRRLLGLVARGAKWDALPYLLLLLRDSEAAAVAFAKDQIARWLVRFNREATNPTQVQRDRISEALARVSADLPAAHQRALQFYCRA